MKYEIKIALPLYKVVYSFLFVTIIILVRPIQSITEIIAPLETYMALLAGIFLADTYYQEFTGGRIDCYYRYCLQKKLLSVTKRNIICLIYLFILVAVGYWGFIFRYQPVYTSAIPEMILYAHTMLATLASMIFMGSIGFTLTNLAQSLGAGISGVLILWLVMTSSVMNKLPECFQLFLLYSSEAQDGTLLPYYLSRGMYVMIGVLLFGFNVLLIQRQPKQRKGWKNNGNKAEGRTP